MTKKDYMLILLAILTGIGFGVAHFYSVALHKVQGDTFDGQIKNKPTITISSEYEPICERQMASEVTEKEVVELVDDGIPKEVKEACEKYGKEYNICPELLESLAYQESRFIADVVSADGACIGLCQVNPKWHKARMKRLGVTDLTDIDQNVHVAADYLAELFEEFDGDVDYLLMAYNGDSRWKKGIVSKFSTEILERSMEYEQLHGKRDF